ncbi:hypothetical protein GCM10007868_18590 [Gluconobacter frateurii]|nr:hypothetical protein GCM10007868_18590 [Gluconobacter frateurii]
MTDRPSQSVAPAYRPPESELRLVIGPNTPDPRLVAFVHFMGRRGARDWFRSQQQEQRRRPGP